MKIRSLIYLLLIIFLSGCISGYKITYNTKPEGASVICNGTNEGYSPVTLNYSPNENNKKIGVMETVPCVAIWNSGAKKDFSNTWDLNKFPNGVIQTLQRRLYEDGYLQDLEFALKRQQMRNQQSQAAANPREKYNLSTPIEDESILIIELSGSSYKARLLADVVKLYGYKCDSISSVRSFTFSNGFQLSCNHFQASYEIEDKGGRWIVTLE